MAETKSVFITGVTGTLGKEFIKELLETTDWRLHLLVRRKGRFSHWDRVRKFLGPTLERNLGTRVQVYDGDVTVPRFGLSEADRTALRGEVRDFYHIAALTSLNAADEDCRRINIGGTAHALELAWDFLKQGKLERFFYFSTAYVAGSRQTYRSKEDELPLRPAHANFYESSKFAAETKVREAMKNGLPVTIFRPSIVVGDSRTGEVSEFNVIYPFLKLFAHGIINVLPTRPENSFNIVPIDFVIKASVAIAKQKDSIGKAFHLVTQNPPAIGLLLKLKEQEYPSMPPVHVIAPEDFNHAALEPAAQTVFRMLEPYLGYLNDDLTFETANTEKALAGTGIAMPNTDYEFLKTIVHYAIKTGYLVVDSTEGRLLAAGGPRKD